MKQYKAWKNHVMETVPKKEQKEVLRRMKDEQTSKMALLSEQYDKSIVDLNQKQSIKLSDSQEQESTQLHRTLQQELEMLIAYQSKVKMVTEAQHDKEMKDLQEKVSLRRAMLEQKMEEDSIKLQNERSDRIRRLLEKQAREIEDFDAESLRMGFSTVVITNYGDQVFVDPRAHQQRNSRPVSAMPGAMHPSASTSAITPGRQTSGSNLPRSNSGSNIRHNQSFPYSHRTTPQQPQGASHQRQHSGNLSYVGQQGSSRPNSANNNRNNSSKMGSPSLQRRVVDGRRSNSPVPGSSRPQFVDEHSPSMLQRVASNWGGADGKQYSNSGRNSPMNLPRHGSLVTLPGQSSGGASALQYHGNHHHSRSGPGRSWDGNEPSQTRHLRTSPSPSRAHSFAGNRTTHVQRDNYQDLEQDDRLLGTSFSSSLH